MTPQELFSFSDFGNAISKAADYGKKVVDAATPVVQEAKSQWKSYDPESYAKYKTYWRPASHAINDFKAKDGWGQISSTGARIANMKDLQNLEFDEQMLQNLGFWSGFKKGFSSVMKPAASIATAIGGATGIPEAAAAGQIFNAANAGVNAIPLKDQLQMQNLWSWKKFGQGFKKGFGMVMKPAAQVASAIGGATGIPEAAAAGKIFSGLNGAVNAIPTLEQQMQLQQLGFWGDFGKGFQKGFGMVMQPAAQIATAVGGAAGVPEAAAAGQIFSGLNGAVQSFN
jgi:hypothetical protein